MRGWCIIICRQVNYFELVSLGEHIIKYLLNDFGHKVSIVAEESTMKRFNGAGIDQTRLYVKKHCRGFIRAVL